MFGLNQFISFYITLFFVFFNVCVIENYDRFLTIKCFFLSPFLCSIDWLIWNHQMSGSIDDDDVFGIIIEFQIFFWFLFFLLLNWGYIKLVLACELFTFFLSLYHLVWFFCHFDKEPTHWLSTNRCCVLCVCV